MSFDFLLESCLLPGDTHFKDPDSTSSLSVSIERKPKETILFFRTDTRGFRERFKQELEREVLCDLLIFYQQGECPSSEGSNPCNQTQLVFVELKGGAIAHGID